MAASLFQRPLWATAAAVLCELPQTEGGQQEDYVQLQEHQGHTDQEPLRGKDQPEEGGDRGNILACLCL